MSDLISRQALREGIEKIYRCDWQTLKDVMNYAHVIDDLPSAEPERKKGKWIEYPDCLQYEGAYSDDHIVCSNCHHVFSALDNCTEEFDFCPHCGADMNDPLGKMKTKTVELTEGEAYSLAEFIDTNIFDTIRNDRDIDSIQWLKNIVHAYEKMCEVSGYVGLTEDAPKEEEDENAG